jgi:hypothetical protein
MAGKNKDIRPALYSFLRYLGKKTSNSERNAFERDLQKDPFAEEAVEGFEGIPATRIEKDLGILQKKLRSKTVNRRRMILYRVAASVAVLMTISSLFFIIKYHKPEIQVSQNISEREFEIAKPPAISEPKQNEDKQIAYNEPKGVAQKKEEVPGVAQKKEEKPGVAVAVDSTSLKAAKNAAPAVAGVAGELKSMSRKQLVDYSPPEPVTGKNEFERYISENIRRPADSKQGEMIVTLSFIVRSTGIRDSIKIISSPGRSFSDEAIRLIKEGPAWIPAERNNTKIDEVVRLRIVFK